MIKVGSGRRKVPRDTGGRPIYYSTNFDGTNDFLSKLTDFTGNADGKEGTALVVFRPTAGDGTVRRFYQSANDYWSIYLNTDNSFNVRGTNAAATQILRITSSAQSILVAGGWKIALAAWKLDTAGARHVYLGNTADTNVLAFTNDTIKYTDSGHYISSTASELQKFTGDIALLWISHTYIDISVEANLRKFITARGGIADLGPNGERPTGTKPLVFQCNPFSSFEKNLGSGGDFTVTGALTAGTSRPPV